jgi:hypothetical protein
MRLRLSANEKLCEHAKIISRVECQETFPNIPGVSAERRAKVAAPKGKSSLC